MNAAEFRAKQKAEADARDAKVSKLRNDGVTMLDIAARLCLSRDQVNSSCRRLGPMVRAKKPAAPPAPKPQPAGPNRFRSAAQNARIAEAKREIGMYYAPRKKLPPVPETEARALIDAAIAAGRVTMCPTMACAAVNAGDGFA